MELAEVVRRRRPRRLPPAGGKQSCARQSRAVLAVAPRRTKASGPFRTAHDCQPRRGRRNMYKVCTSTRFSYDALSGLWRGRARQ